MTHHSPAYTEGRAAFADGERREHNPYAGLDTMQAESLAWLQGWDAEQLDRFDPITLELGDEIYFEFHDEYQHGRLRLKYYYRAMDNRLFMTLADTLELARIQRDQWEMRRLSHRNKMRMK